MADRLADHREPVLIGVRHHSPALAAAMPALLEAADPEVLLVELPQELGEWLPHLADPDLLAPVALSGAARDGGSLAFYPFADFSPELAAIRWARRNGVEVRPCDLPIALRGDGHRGGHDHGTPLADALRGVITGRDGDDLWDRLVEAAAPGQAPESVRRAALLVGLALRRDAEGPDGDGVDGFDLRREEWMRHAVADVAGRRSAAVIGSFHAAALLRGPDGDRPAGSGPEVVTSLVPYGFALLDERSGYPAGIRDPEWQQAVYESGGDAAAVEASAAAFVVRICARVRELGHPAGPGEAREALRLAVDLAKLRGLPAPGRGELVEAVQSVLTHAEPLGRGRVVARAAGDVLVGQRLGLLAPGTPRSGLAPAVEALVEELRLPGPGSTEPAQLRLDPLRSPLDARREVALRRLDALGVPYGSETATAGVGGGEALTTRWTVAWTPATAATLPVAGMWGATLELAARGRLMARRAERERGGGHTPAEVLADLAEAAACGLPDVVGVLLDDAAAVLPTSGTLHDLLAALSLLDRLRAGHLPGTPGEVLDGHPVLSRDLETAAVAQLEGLAGSDDPADARALVELGQRHDAHGTGVRLAVALRELADGAGPLIAGAAGATRVLLGLAEPAELGERVASWIDTASTPEGRDALKRALTGVLAAATALLETTEALEPLLDRVESLDDRAFLDRLPALRGAFTTIGPAARARVLAVVQERVGARVDRAGDPDPELLALWLGAEREAVEALRLHGLDGAAAGGGDAGAAEAAAGGAAAGGAAAGGAAAGGAAAATGSAAGGATADAFPASTTSAATTMAVGVSTSVPEPGGSAPTSGEGAGTPGAAGPTGPEGAGAAGPEGAASPASPVGAADAVGAASPTGPAVADLGPAGADEAGPTPPAELAPVLRWRLLLGARGDRPAGGGRYAAALDELYGHDRGEGADSGSLGGSAGGDGDPFPVVREWSDELRALFGDRVREEVLAAAAEGGRLEAALEIDPTSVRPSVDLLRNVLSLAGGLSEDALARLRPLVARLVRELAEQLANRIRPALTGMQLPFPTRRPGGKLDLPRTLRANLATARRDERGKVVVIPERPVFRSRGRKANDWRLILVVDVSGSMEASTVWAALTASVFAGVRSLTTHFLAFSTQVVDLSERVADPLSLLLEVRVGGGTHIAGALRHARDLVTVPERTMVVLVSDFEEGGPVASLTAQVRELVSAGVTVLGCASLDDTGKPRYSTSIAGSLVAAGMPVAALSPQELARWVGEKVRG
ncbi:VWA containing CoxE family protein [Actinosynnema pretiosum]|uniref:VWA containing CoxE family protein n=2 Tax=Actinosynnema TaxID=40566 RepID=A0A290Z4Z1_9PSEU|nr:VWA containing CoxE family protein [Actinosynnema pretiosum]